jgi:hypothetical protein
MSDKDIHSSLAGPFARDLVGAQCGSLGPDAEAIYSSEGTREMNTPTVGRAITGLSAFA